MKYLKNPDNGRELALTNFGTELAVLGAAFGALIYLAAKLLGDDFGEVIRWWLMLLAAGIAFFPLTVVVLRKFRDSGWIFSKVIGIAFSGWLMWFLSSIKLLKFNNINCWICVMVCFALNVAIYFIFIGKNKKDYDVFQRPQDVLTHALLAEVLFLAAFIIWNYIKGFKPEAYGTTEKMMDYGFMKSMFKSDYMPPEDMWLAGESINYYYVGQFLATFMTKLAGTGVEYGYNLTLTMLAALGFSLPCSIVFNVADNFKDIKEKYIDRIFPYIAGVISGLAVSVAGNMHYCIYNNVVPTVRTMLGLDGLAEKAGYSYSNYWFPNATRYIGYNPETADKTIHEFPSYSFILGDLHAHVINIMFVLTVVAILFGLLLLNKKRLKDAVTGQYQKADAQKGISGFSFKEIFAPSVLLVGFFIGLFHTTNYWDYPIYFVVSGAVILFMNARLYNFTWNTLILTLFHAVVVIVTAKVTALPFTLNFNQIASKLNICENHTPLYQLLILWGLPAIVTLWFLGALVFEKRGYAPFADRRMEEPGKKNALYRFIANLNISDMFVLTIGLCAIGLVLLPELVYVKDIYSGDYKRANTMFKLTYQAYILFGMTMGYVITKFIFYARKTSQRVFGIIALWLLISTIGYFDNAVNAWFGDFSFKTPEVLEKDAEFVLTVGYTLIGIVFAVEVLYLFAAKKKKSKTILFAGTVCLIVISVVVVLFGEFYQTNLRYKGLNSGVYLMDENFDDYEATNWINENIEGRPVLLEANGNSYTYYERVSTITGLPTILGWRTHEWLWQSTSADGGVPKIVTEREADIDTIYRSEDIGLVRELLNKYNVEYIYIGGCEREKFTDINFEGLMKLCSVCYPEDFESYTDTETFILKVNR